ncbi:MAG: aminoglycoside 6-adenylyltransferase [Gemmatimonadaceae bacterium]
MFDPRTLFNTIQLFHRVANEVAERLNLTYPQDLDVRMTDYLQQVKASSVKPV